MRFWILVVSWLSLMGMGPRLWGEDLSAAERALESRQNRLATEQFEALLEKDLSGEAEVRAGIGLARAYVLAGRLADAEKVLEGLPAIGDPVWSVAATLVATDLALLRGDVRKAGDLLRTVPQALPTPEWENRRVLLQARLRAGKGKYEEALLGLEGLKDPLFLQEKAALFAQMGQTENAVALWVDLAKGPAAALSTQQAKLALIEQSLLREDWETVGAQLQTLLEEGGVYEELEPRAYPLFIRWFAHEKAYGKQIAYLEALEKRLIDPAALHNAKAYRAEALIREGELEAAEKLLQEQIAKTGDHPLLAESQMLFARTLSEQGQIEKARDAYASYLSVFTQPAGVTEALVGQARMEEKLERWAQAEALYGRAASMTEDPGFKVQLRVKRADMAMAAGQAEQAHGFYREVLKGMDEDPLKGHVMFHAAVTMFESDPDRLRGAIRRLRELRVELPQDPFAEKALLQIALLQQEAGQFSPALGSFTSYINEYPEGVYVVDAKVDKGISAYRNNYYKIALAQFEEVIEKHADHPRAEQANSLMGWMLYLMGQDERARQVGEAFLSQYPDSEFEPHVRLWLAGMSFNRGQFEQAETEFFTLAEKAKDVNVEIQARYYAGRAALSRKEFVKALEHFNAALERAGEHGEDTLELDYTQEALFYKGDAQTELDRFDEAIVTFNLFMTQYPDSYLKYAAVGRRGDCQFTLGESNADRYLEALDSYRQVTEASSVRADVQLQALYKLGRTQMALKREEAAFRTYQQVMDRYLAEQNQMGNDAAGWFVRAVTDAAQAREDREEYREAVRIYKLLSTTSLPQAKEAGGRMEQIIEEQNLLQFQGEEP